MQGPAYYAVPQNFTCGYTVPLHIFRRQLGMRHRRAPIFGDIAVKALLLCFQASFLQSNAIYGDL